MSEPTVAIDYDDRGARAAHSVLLELGQVLGAHRDAMVVIGGSVPSILMPKADPAHVGTLDIDLDLDPEKLADHGYADLVEILDAAGYERNVEGLKPFQLRRSRCHDSRASARRRASTGASIAGRIGHGEVTGQLPVWIG